MPWEQLTVPMAHFTHRINPKMKHSQRHIPVSFGKYFIAIVSVAVIAVDGCVGAVACRRQLQKSMAR